MSEPVKKKKFSLLPYLIGHKWEYAAGIAVLLIVDVANLYVPQYIGEIVDGLTGHTIQTVSEVWPFLRKILAAGLVMTAGRFGWRFFIIGVSRKIEYQLRNDMFAHLETLSARYYTSHKTGDLMAHFTNDLQAIRMAVGMAVITTFDAVIMTVMVLVKMIVYVDFKLTLLSFIPLTLVAAACYFFGKESKVRQLKRQQAFSDLSDQVQESMAGIRVLKAFVQEKEDMEDFTASSKNAMEKNLSMIRLRSVIGPSFDAITGISLLTALVFGGKMVLGGKVSIGRFVAFNSYIGMLVWPMIACGECINNFSQAAAAYKRISKVFAEEPDIADLPDAKKEKKALSGAISFRNLTFCYPGTKEPVLKNIHLEIPAGETLGILGRTGSGKSTAVSLLLRVFDCKKGMLLLDGIPIDEIPLALLHRDIACVPQDNFLFSDTIEENIAFGLEKRVSEDPKAFHKVQEAAENACIHDNIMDFPEQYRTVTGERGVALSGGQKQRSSIARALIKDSPILILDDSLSAVDTDTEEKILQNLMRVRKKKTTILIAHRISALRRADHIAVLSDGEITEYGTHEELIRKNGFYAEISRRQQLEDELKEM